MARSGSNRDRFRSLHRQVVLINGSIPYCEAIDRLVEQTHHKNRTQLVAEAIHEYAKKRECDLPKRLCGAEPTW